MKFENVEISKREKQIMFSGFGLGVLFMAIVTLICLIVLRTMFP